MLIMIGKKSKIKELTNCNFRYCCLHCLVFSSMQSISILPLGLLILSQIFSDIVHLIIFLFFVSCYNSTMTSPHNSNHDHGHVDKNQALRNVCTLHMVLIDINSKCEGEIVIKKKTSPWHLLIYPAKNNVVSVYIITTLPNQIIFSILSMFDCTVRAPPLSRLSFFSNVTDAVFGFKMLVTIFAK